MASRYSRRRLWRYGISGAALMMALSAPVVAAAQDPAPPEDGQSEVGELVITGFRASLRTAVEAKRAETDIVDVIKAEDIADFPDANLAEAIQRIPGVAIDRDAGEGRSITVRGLGPDFTRTRINGMEAQASTGGTDSSGGANRGRGFDFNVFASELFNSITVRKTSAAEIEEGSLGATVDLQTTRPFDYRNKGFVAAGSAQYGYNDLSEAWDPRIAFLVSDTWLEGRLGLLASVAYSERNLFEEGFSSVRWERGTDNGGFCSPVGFAPQNPSNNATNGTTAANCAVGVPRPANTAANIAAYNTVNSAVVFHPRLPRYGRLVHDQQRLGATASLQFEPADGTRFTLDLVYSKYEATRQENFLESLSFSRNAAAGGKTQINVLQAEVSPIGELVYGVFDNVDVRSEQRFDVLKTDFFQPTLTFEHDFTDRFRMRAYIGRSESRFDNPVQTTVTFDRQNVDGYSFDFREDRNTPRIDYGFDVNNPANWAWRDITVGATGVAPVPRSEIRLRPTGGTNLFEAAQLDFVYDLNDTLTFKFGANGKTYSSSAYDIRRTEETFVPALPPGVTFADIATSLTGFGSGLGQPAGNATAWVVPNLDAIASTFNIYCNCDTGVPGGDFRLTGPTNGNARAGNRLVTEQDSAVYGQVDFKTEVATMPFRGNVGVRYVTTDVYAEGYSSLGSGTLVFGTHRYTDTLPSLNLALNVRPDFIVRFGAAKVMARPQIGNTLSGTNYLVPITSLSAGGPNFTAGIGNVALDPFRADTYDLSLEWYFAPEALVSLALFRKDIDSFIQVVRQDLPYSELTDLNPIAFAPGLCTGNCSPSTIFQLSRAINTTGGKLEGFEISYQQPFSFLPAPFDDFGVQLNYTKVKSTIQYCDTNFDALCTQTIPEDLFNLSPTSYNATLYYENETFSARVSAAYRDGYLQNVPGRNGNPLEGKLETLNVDASATYRLTDRVTLTFEGLNLTDEFNHQWVGSDERQSTSVYHHTGRQFYVGARVNF
jgi:iron complex outermembrane recepter protein